MAYALPPTYVFEAARKPGTPTLFRGTPSVLAAAENVSLLRAGHLVLQLHVPLKERS